MSKKHVYIAVAGLVVLAVVCLLPTLSGLYRKHSNCGQVRQYVVQTKAIYGKMMDKVGGHGAAAMFTDNYLNSDPDYLKQVCLDGTVSDSMRILDEASSAYDQAKAMYAVVDHPEQ